jgi:hypothetical protein
MSRPSGMQIFEANLGKRNQDEAAVCLLLCAAAHVGGDAAARDTIIGVITDWFLKEADLLEKKGA